MYAVSLYRLATVSVARHQRRHLSELRKQVLGNVNTSCITHTSILRRPLHTSNISRSATGLGAVALIFYRPIAKVVAVIFGRSLRKWWQSVPFRERMRRTAAWLSRNRVGASVGAGLIASSWVVFYITHLEKVPLIGRVRFVPLTPYQYKKISDAEEEMILSSLKDDIINPEEAKAMYQAVSSVGNRILQANTHLIPGVGDRKWKIVLVNNMDANAFAVPGGSIYVFTGLFNVVANEHELAMVMAHEMSHVVLGHGLENITRATLMDVFLTIIMASLWCIMPGDGVAAVTSWFCHRVASLLFHLPFSRNLEREADAAGLDMLARACFDPRQAAVVWRKMEILQEILEDYEVDKSSESKKPQTAKMAMPKFLVSTSIGSESSVVNQLIVSPVTPADKNSVVASITTASKAADVAPEKEGQLNKSERSKVATDFFSTHPSPSERYATICDVVNSGGTAQAAKEGRCFQPELTKSLPQDYDSPRKLRSDLIEMMGPLLILRVSPEEKAAAAAKSNNK